MRRSALGWTIRSLIFALAAGLLAFGAVSCGEGGGGGGEPDAGDTGPDASAAALAITSPQADAFLESTRADVSIHVAEPTTISEVTLRVMGQTMGTEPVQADSETTLTFDNVDLSAWNGSEKQVILEAVGAKTSGGQIVSEPVGVHVDTRRAATDELAELSEIAPVIEWDRSGFPSFVHMDVPAPQGDDPVDRGFDFIENHKDLLLIDHPRQVLAPGRVNVNDDGQTDVLFEQHLGSMPVDSAALVISYDETGQRIEALTGNYVVDLPEPTEARVSKAEAESTAMQTGVGDIGEHLFASGYTRKVVYDPALYDTEAPSDPTIAWRVHVQGQNVEEGHPGYWKVFVDAQTGRVLDTIGGVFDAKNLRVKVLNANGKTASDGASQCMSSFLTRTKPACFQNIAFRSDGCNGNADADGEASDARSKAIDVHHWLNNKFGWTTNHKGGIIKPIVNVTFNSGPNAQSMSGFCKHQLQFSDDWMVPDVFYHEFGHRLVGETGTDFNYKNESGALHEHYADLFAAIIEGEDDGVGFDPQEGEDLPASARGGNSELRNLQDPPSDGDKAKYSNRYTGNADKGGVHTNSTIPSKATWLITKGGQFNGFQIDALGADKMRKIMWNTLKSSMTNSSTDFAGYANASINIARRKFGDDEACQVRNAFAAVEIVAGDSDCDGTLNDAVNDNDDDGTPDAADNCPQIYNPSQTNTDGNAGGDACDDDDDGDGVDDPQDNCPSIANGAQTDRNDNGVGDACEDIDGDLTDGYKDNCPTTENFSQTDTDGDGKGDACDDDDDGDGIDDGSDNCPQTANPAQADRDNDGVGDQCADPDGDGIVDANDGCPDTYTYPDPDQDDDGLLDACEDDDDDNDGVPDGNDNCRFVQNESQFDGDGDGAGDACDNCPSVENPEQKNADGDSRGDACDTDDDGDGVLDEVDNCPTTANSRQIDSDGDGVGDACGGHADPDWLHRQIEAAQQLAAAFPSLFDTDIHDRGVDIFNGVDMPIDVCKRAICRDTGYVPAGYQVSVGLNADFRFRAAVINGRGEVVRMLDPGQLEPGDNSEFAGTITFEPDAGSYFETDSVADHPFQSDAYKLRVVGDPEYDTGDAQQVGLEVTEGMAP